MEDRSKSIDDWMLAGALYASKGVSNQLWAVGLFPLIFGLMFMYYYSEVPSEGIGIEIAGIFLIVLGIAVIVLFLRRSFIVKRTIYFVLFKDHLMLLPMEWPPMGKEYVRINYKDITEYTLKRGVSYDMEDNTSSFPHYDKYGVLTVSAGGVKYKTNIKSIADVWEWMQKLVPVRGTYK